MIDDCGCGACCCDQGWYSHAHDGEGGGDGDDDDDVGDDGSRDRLHGHNVMVVPMHTREYIY